MKKFYSFLAYALAVVIGKAKAFTRTQLIGSAAIWAVISLGFLILTVSGGWFAGVTTLYVVFSCFKRVAEFLAESANGWSPFVTQLYEWANIEKQALIEGDGVAAFLDACNVSPFGKSVQIIFLMIGTITFISALYIAWKAISLLYSEAILEYISNHRRSNMYQKYLRRYISDYRSRGFSSGDMVSDRRYRVFYREESVKRLLTAKLAREQAEKKGSGSTIPFESARKKRRQA